MGKAFLIGIMGLWFVGCAARQDPISPSLKRALSLPPQATPEEMREREAAFDNFNKKYNAPIPITTGAISQAYEILGDLKVDTTDILLSTSDVSDVLFRSKLSIAAQGHSPKLSHQQMEERLRAAARNKWGLQVDAVINVSYNTNYYGDVFASGLAVHFIESQPAPVGTTSTIEQKLTELKTLREKNLITPEEYDNKRSELLKGL